MAATGSSVSVNLTAPVAYHTFNDAAGAHTLKSFVTACYLPVTRTTLGLGESAACYMSPGISVDWSVTGGGSISSTNGSGTTFTASHSPSTATVHAKKNGAELTKVFNVIPPSSITVVGQTNSPLGIENPSGTLMGAKTVYATIVGSTNVSFENAQFRENPEPANMSVTWPNGTNTIIQFQRSTNSGSISCGGLVPDTITSVVVSTNYLFNGTNFVDFSYTSSWTEQYKNEAGVWTDYYTLTATYLFRGSDKKCQITYLGVPGSPQGPY